MKRKEFLKTCGLACLGTMSASFLLQSCMATKSLNADLDGHELKVKLDAFKNTDSFFKYLIVRNSSIAFPIYVFRFSDVEYKALYLQCTHQGNEVNAYGDKLVCEAHGSEFNNRGNVTKGPAEKPLHAFPIQITNSDLIISITQS